MSVHPGSAIPPGAAAPEAPVPPMPLVSRILGSILSPGAVFANLRHHPRILGVFLISLVVSILSYLAISPIITQTQLEQMTEAIEKNENIAAEQKNEIIERQTAMMANPLMKALGPITAVLFIGGFYLLCGWLLQIGCNFLLGAQITFRQGMAGAVHASLPATILGALIKTPLVLMTKNLHAATSLALVLPDAEPSSALYGLLNAFDVFTIWTAIMISLAAAGLTGMKSSRTRPLAILFMVVAVVFSVIGSLLQGLGG